MTAPFEWSPGTNGFTSTPFNLMSSELNSLATGNTATSSVGGTSGVFSQTDIDNALLAEIWFSAGGAFTPTTGAYIAGWFLRSSDGGTTFEKTVSNTAVARQPDFVIPFINSAHASGNLVFASGPVIMPATSHKLFVRSVAGVTLPASGNLILCGPVKYQY